MRQRISGTTLSAPVCVPLILLLAGSALGGSFLDLEVELSGGPSFPIGSWGQHLSSGFGCSLGATWHPYRILGAGLSVDGELYSSAGREEASLTRLSPMLHVSLFLRPGARSFNPGIVAAFGVTRSKLTSGTGSDPASWDPSWRAGVRWGFSLGGEFRCRVGFDFGSVIAREQAGDYFDLRLGILREVSL